jgi:hypothetical protein
MSIGLIGPFRWIALNVAACQNNTEQLRELVDSVGGPTACLGPIFLSRSIEIFFDIGDLPRTLVGALLKMGADLNTPFPVRYEFSCTAFQAMVDTCVEISPDGLELLQKILNAGADLFGFWPTSDLLANMKRTNFRNSFYVTGIRNIQVALITMPEEASSLMLDHIKCRDAEALEIVNGVISIKNKHNPGQVHMTNTLSFSAFAGHAQICRRLVLDFGAEVNKTNPDGNTPLQVATNELNRIYKTKTCSTLLNLGANPLFTSADMYSSFTECMTLLDDPFFVRNESAMQKLEDIIKLMQQHARFRVALRIIRAGNAAPGSLFGPFSNEVMEHLAVKLAPKGSLLSKEMIVELYASPRPWFTSVST